MRPAAGQGLEEDGRHGGERLALAGRHLDDPALREGEAGEDLLVERALPEGAAGRLAGEGEGLRKLGLGRDPGLHAGAERPGPRLEAGVVERGDGGLEVGDPGEGRPVCRQVVLDRPAAQAIEKVGEPQRLSVLRRMRGKPRALMIRSPTGGHGHDQLRPSWEIER